MRTTIKKRPGIQDGQHIRRGDQQVPNGTNTPGAWGVRPLERRHNAPVVVNMGYRDLCEIGYELAKGFAEYTDWGYWMITMGQSWIQERPWWSVPTGEAGGQDALAMAQALVESADIIHINSNHDLPWLTDVIGGKKVIIHHHGGSYRRTFQWLEKLEREAGYTRLVSTPDLLMYQSVDAPKDLVWLPSPINVRELDRNYPRAPKRAGDPCRVAHGYTIKANKGTDAFLEMANDIEGLVVGAIHGIGRRQSLWYMAQADMYFATYLLGPGVATYEAMAFGIPALVGCTAQELEYQMEAVGVDKPEDLPWVYVTTDTCKRWLADLAHDDDLREHWGQKGRKYIEDVHDIPQVVRRVKEIYECARPCSARVKF